MVPCVSADSRPSNQGKHGDALAVELVCAPLAPFHGDMHLRVGDHFTIPEAELHWRFSPAGGPGGQHANRAATRAELSWDVAASSAPTEEERALLLQRLDARLDRSVLTVAADDSRSQWRNRQLARRRLRELVEGALRPQKRRRPTRPTPASRQRRVDEKRRRGQVKRLRRPPEVD